jgi:acid phosphatase type 7
MAEERVTVKKTKKLVLVGWAFLGAGCAGTSPNLSTPQMQTPSLGGGLGSRSVASPAPGATAEASLAPLETVATPEKTFVQPPYLQLGNRPNLGGKTEGLELLWIVPADTKLDEWSVETRLLGATTTTTTWTKIKGKLSAKPVAVGVIKPELVVSAPLEGLAPGKLFDYRILRADKPVFAARARARKTAKEPQRFVLFGDCAQGTDGQKKVAAQTLAAKPDYVFITGDIVYGKGLASEYVKNYWPVYNADAAGADGVPLLRSTLTVAAPGNHDIRSTTLEKTADGFAYFYYWNQPLNGPMVASTKFASPLGSTDTKAFMTAAGERYPRMASFSYDYGNAHWTVLDANAYMDWSDPALKQWVEADLKAAQKSIWRFVAFHHPPFNSNAEHFNDQWMRVLAPLFEKYGVSVVWAGHVHDYQRSYPLTFLPAKPRDAKGAVEGKLTLDKTYDGVKNTKPNAPIYIVSGAGGAGLYKNIEKGKLQDFTAKYIDDTHSLTVVDITDKTLIARQVGADGKELDHWTITK